MLGFLVRQQGARDYGTGPGCGQGPCDYDRGSNRPTRVALMVDRSSAAKGAVSCARGSSVASGSRDY